MGWWVIKLEGNAPFTDGPPSETRQYVPGAGSHHSLAKWSGFGGLRQYFEIADLMTDWPHSKVCKVPQKEPEVLGFLDRVAMVV